MVYAEGALVYPNPPRRLLGKCIYPFDEPRYSDGFEVVGSLIDVRVG